MSEAFNLTRLKAEGRNHWKKYLPAMHARLERAGTLEQALTEAATQTRKLLDQANDAGMTDAEAWPEVRAQFLILDPAEAGEQTEPEPQDET